MSPVDAAKISEALARVSGKTIERVFVAGHKDGRFQLYLVFRDGTYYEFYGTGALSGARCIDRGDPATVRAFLDWRNAEVVEIGGPPGES